MMSFESFVRLGWSFVRTVVRNALVQRSQLPRFLSQYRPDGMVSAEPADHNVLVGAGRCIACGRCDVRALELGAWEALGPRGPMAFVLGASRLAGADDVDPARATPALLEELTAACPVAVPFAPLAALVRRHRAELAAASGGASAALDGPA